MKYMYVGTSVYKGGQGGQIAPPPRQRSKKGRELLDTSSVYQFTQNIITIY